MTAPPPPADPDAIEIGAEGRYERLELMPWWDTAKMRRSRLLVVGAGAVGNEVLKNLALLGAGTVYVVDHDVVETTNLARCILFRAGDEGEAKAAVAARRLAEINPETTLVPLTGTLEAQVGIGFLRSCDVVLCCLDNIQARLHLDRLCQRAGVDLLDGAIDALGFQVQAFDHSRPGGASYADTLPAGVLVGGASCRDIQVAASTRGHIATTPVSASLCGALLVQEAVKRIHARDGEAALPANGEGVRLAWPEPLRGAAIVGQGAVNSYGIERLPDPPPRAAPPDPSLVALDGHWGSLTMGDLLARAQADLGSPFTILDIAYEIKLEATCPDCERVFRILGPEWHVGQFGHECLGTGGEGADPNWGLALAEGGHVTGETALLGLTPEEWHLPPWHEYLAVAPDAEDAILYSFAGDREQFEAREAGE